VSEDSVVADVVARLESLGLEYMIVGSYASNVWGRPRASYDADIVLRITPGDADRFAKAFSDGYVVDRRALRDDLERGSMFNLIPKSGIFKVDLIPVRRTAYAESEFSRRRQVRALGHSLWVASPEDTVLFKLSRFRQGDEVSGRQLEDARDVLSAQGDLIDVAYLEAWASTLGVSDLLEKIRRSAR
jgi:hypothetical protein